MNEDMRIIREAMIATSRQLDKERLAEATETILQAAQDWAAERRSLIEHRGWQSERALLAAYDVVATIAAAAQAEIAAEAKP